MLARCTLGISEESEGKDTDVISSLFSDLDCTRYTVAWYSKLPQNVRLRDKSSRYCVERNPKLSQFDPLSKTKQIENNPDDLLLQYEQHVRYFTLFARCTT